MWVVIQGCSCCVRIILLIAISCIVIFGSSLLANRGPTLPGINAIRDRFRKRVIVRVFSSLRRIGYGCGHHFCQCLYPVKAFYSVARVLFLRDTG